MTDKSNKNSYCTRIHTNLSYEIVKIVNIEHIHEPPNVDMAAKNVRVVKPSIIQNRKYLVVTFI